ncbi:MAG: BatA and WFA domain-containing protein [Chloroflexota bacterium]|nr:BatA and WFA domain-containing protein [Chloroflexota bacterium]
MNLVAPLGLAFGALIPVLIVFYLLKVRRHDVEVSSTFLWEQLHRDLVAHEPWQRLKTSLLLLLQILLMALLALGVARPFLTVQAQASDNVVILLDASGSMRATDVKPSRFEAARAAARQIVDRLSDDATGTIIRVTDHPQVLAQGPATKAQLYDALDHASVSSSPTNMREAIQLALSLNKGKTRSQIFVVSDGAFPDMGDLSAAGSDIHFVPVGRTGQNQGITVLSARPDPNSPDRQHIFVRVQNFAPQPGSNLLSLYADGKLLDSASLKLAAKGKVDHVFDNLPAGTRVVEARLRDGDDLATDNDAWLVLNRASASKVLLVTPNNLFLEKAINLVPNVELFKVNPKRYAGIDSGQYNLFVFDGFLPAQLPGGNMMIINPPTTDWLPIEGDPLPRPRVTSFRNDDPLLSYVSFNEVQLQRVKPVTPPPWATVLAESGNTPLLLAGNNEGHKMVILPFDLHWSNFGLLTSFPIFMANAIAYLQPADPSDIKSPTAGNTVLLQAIPGADEVDVRKPDGGGLTFKPYGKPIAFSQTDEVGLYQVTHKTKGKAIQTQVFAINETDQDESNIAPRSSLGVGGTVVKQNQAIEWTPARREFWPWVVLFGIGLLVFEWYWYHRRA